MFFELHSSVVVYEDSVGGPVIATPSRDIFLFFSQQGREEKESYCFEKALKTIF
jgi:hypothetical protein